MQELSLCKRCELTTCLQKSNKKTKKKQAKGYKLFKMKLLLKLMFDFQVHNSNNLNNRNK